MARIETGGCPRNTPTTRTEKVPISPIFASFGVFSGHKHKQATNRNKGNDIMNTKVIKTPTEQPRNHSPFAFLFALYCFALLPGMQAVFPPPQGGYAGGNTAVGASALLSLTSGTFSTAAV